MTHAGSLRSLICADIHRLEEEIETMMQDLDHRGRPYRQVTLVRLRGRREGLLMAVKLVDEVFFSEWKVE